jgi:hypothetical protein
MAVVAPPPLKLNLEFWASSDSTLYPVHSPEPMTDVMSYQYPPPPQNGDEMEIPPSGYMPNYSGHHEPSSGMDMGSSPESGHSMTDRRDSYSTSMKLKRSISTPTVRPPQTQSQQSQLPPSQISAAEQNALNLAAAEKRRNKLGYHRTSVACGKYSPGDATEPHGFDFSGDADLVLLSRALPQTEDKMHTVSCRPSGPMRQLYSPEKRMQLLSSGPATVTRHETEVDVSVVGWAKDSLSFIISCDANGLTIGRPWTAISALDDAIDPEHGTANEATGNEELLSGSKE